MIALIICLCLIGGFFALAWRNLGLAARLLIVYLPVQLAFNVLPGADIASSRVFSLLLGAVWIIHKLQATSYKLQALKIPYLLLPTSYLLFLLWSSVSLIGVFPFEPGLRKLLFWLSYLPLLLVVIDTHRDQLNRFRLAVVVAWSGTLAAAAAMVPIIMSWFMGASEAAQWWLANVSPYFIGATVAQSVSQYPSWFAAVGFSDVFRAVGLFPDPHMLAFFLEMTIPVTIAVAIVTGVSGIKYYVSSILQLGVLFLTFSRGAYVGIFAAGVVGFLLLLWRYLSTHRFTYIIRNTLYLILIAAAFAAVIWHTPISARLTDLADTSTEGRLALWQTAYETTLAHPFRGVGLGNFPYVMDPTADYRTPIYAHNLYLDISSELGFVGLALWLMLILPGLKSIIIKKAPAVSLAAALSLIAFSSHAFFDTPLFSPQVLPLLLVIIVIGSALKSEERSLKRERSHFLS